LIVSDGSRQNWKNNRFGGESTLTTEHANKGRKIRETRVALGGYTVITRHCHLLKKKVMRIEKSEEEEARHFSTIITKICLSVRFLLHTSRGGVCLHLNALVTH